MGCGSSVEQKNQTQQSAPTPAETSEKSNVGSTPSSQTASAPSTDKLAILVDSAKSLGEGALLEGHFDAYVVCRVGAKGSAWTEKPAADEQRSHSVWDDPNPVWKLAFTYLASQPLDNLEIHLKIFDKDLVSADDFIAETRISLQTLKQHENELRDYDLTGKAAAQITVMVGSKVQQSLLQELKTAQEEEKKNGWVSNIVKALHRLGQSVNEASGMPYYYAQTVQMLLAWQTPSRSEGDYSFEWFRKRGTDPKTGQDTYRWDGPEYANSETIMGFDDCKRSLVELGAKLGTNDGNGSAFKPNWLGYNKENSAIWPEVPWKGIALCMPQEIHGKFRPLLTKLCGPCGRWSSQWITEEVRAFFHGREVIRVNEDIRWFNCQLLHQIFLGIKPTEQEAEEFMNWQKKILIAAGAPENLLELAVVKETLDLDGCLAYKVKYLAKMKPALKKTLPSETEHFSEEEMTQLASCVMDAMLFAGGQSVPTVLAFALALPYSSFGMENLPADFSLDNTQQLSTYVWEVIRRWPPVAAFVYQERSFGTSPDKRVFLNLSTAAQDPRVWGGTDAGRFKLRPISEYHANMICFADFAVAPKVESANAHSCPAKDLAFTTVMCFLKEFIRTAHHVEGGHKRLWRPHVAEAEADGRFPEMKPDDIVLNQLGVTLFRLEKDSSAQGPPEAITTAEWLLEQLSTEERAKLEAQVARQDKMYHNVHSSTHGYATLTRIVVTPGFKTSSGLVAPPIKEDLTDSSLYMKPGIGGLQFCKSDEDFEPSWLTSFGSKAGLPALQVMDVEEHEKEHAWFDSAEEAAHCMEVNFGAQLPAQFNTWEDLPSDAGMWKLCVFGVGSWYLKTAKSAAEASHEVPEGAMFECDLEYLSKYNVRSSWIRYGQTIYFAGSTGDNLPGPLLGIWSCHHERLVRPGDDLWEHVKAGFRSSLGTSLTLKDHLASCHWIYANGLDMAARQSLGPDHPLRRLLKQFYYGTASINIRSVDVLLPQGQLAHQTFAFQKDSWVAYFEDIFSSFEWVSFPENLKRRGFSKELLEALPLSADGQLFWETVQQYVQSFLKIFFSDDSAIRADSEILAFWANFESQFNSSWRLPELSFENLVCLVTDLIWWVTGGHEYFGSIVEYLVPLGGLAGKLMDGKTVPDVQSFTQALIIISLTGVKQPQLMDEWTHLFHSESWSAEKQQQALDVVRQFQVDLASCGHEIANRNIVRERSRQGKLMAFDPHIMETSVSI